MSTPFKMKGSPMQRNFGIGSPLQDVKYASYDKDDNPIGDPVEHTHKGEKTYLGTGDVSGTTKSAEQFKKDWQKHNDGPGWKWAYDEYLAWKSEEH